MIFLWLIHISSRNLLNSLPRSTLFLLLYEKTLYYRCMVASARDILSMGNLYIWLIPKSPSFFRRMDCSSSPQFTSLLFIISNKAVHSPPCRPTFRACRRFLVTAARYFDRTRRRTSECLYCIQKWHTPESRSIGFQKRRIIWKVCIYITALSTLCSNSF